MTRLLLLCCAGAVASILPLGCADDPGSKVQRPVYSHENIEMGGRETGYEYRTEEVENKELAPPQRK